MRWFLRLVAGSFVVGVVLLGWAVIVEPQLLVVRQVDIQSPEWPSKQGPLKAALIADLHTGSLWNGPANTQRVVDAVNAEAPDIILLLGDYVSTTPLSGTFVPPEVTAEVLSGLVAPMGVFAVLGNHDWWLDGPRVRRALEQHGIVVLDDDVRIIRTAGGPFALVGIPDDTTRSPDVRRTVSAVPDGLPSIVITHDPAVFDEIPAVGVAATFAGHTHGGQVNLPFVGALVVPGRAPNRWAHGHIEEDGRHMYVSAGVGTSILPIRFNMPPAVEIITLRSSVGRS